MPAGDKRAPAGALTVEEQVQQLLHDDIVLAVTALANGAATLDAAREIIASQLADDAFEFWFLVRALAHEHGLDVAKVGSRSREVAAGRMTKLK